MKINLFTNYYKAKTEERQKEIDFCSVKHYENVYIDRIIRFSVVDSIAFGYKGGKKIKEIINIKVDRPTYQDFFDAASKYPDDINIIANSDIYFDETIELVKQIKDNEVYCLTRWEWNEGDIQSFYKIHGCPPEWSQDCVIWKGVNRLKGADKVWATNLLTNKDELIPYTLGHPGQENHMAWLLKNAGYAVRNPSQSIRAIHVHKDRERPEYSHRIKGQNGGSNWGRLLKVEPCAI